MTFDIRKSQTRRSLRKNVKNRSTKSKRKARRTPQSGKESDKMRKKWQESGIRRQKQRFFYPRNATASAPRVHYNVLVSKNLKTQSFLKKETEEDGKMQSSEKNKGFEKEKYITEDEEYRRDETDGKVNIFKRFICARAIIK